MEKKNYTSIDQYIADFSGEVQERLKRIRVLIRECAPQASEKISYQMPTFFLKGNLVHFAAFSKHIGFYPAPDGITAFDDELTPYKHGKGSVQFPLDAALLEDLIRRIVKYRVEQNLNKK